ncbi:MAG: 3-methyl-2-oxobutanoate hydroxymethyltransferase [Gammaproteobacteria bacterium]|nr:3-methyl-2-oxobutanoate hydroxymethyltransferase [Gammaproteobacteria bacterium]MDH5303915.1 3-methyl-2-oxobutanoate hydroxymethyltransferase [Gammaproteobacteria bacterium]MDH5321789.1 3-methyl-2-oxobutanoate hydroxymethyltransferase [Gammaproteobacteria bacterium]
MPRILDYNGRDVDRSVTVASIVAQRNAPQPLSQVTAGTAEEAAAAEAAGIEMVVCLSDNVAAVREGSSRLFVTAAIDFSGAVSDDDLLGTAYTALQSGADAVITARRFASIRRIADEDIPVMGHLGFVPKKSTLYGGVRAVGKTAAEATALWDQFRRLEDAGAFAVECELIPARVMREIRQRTRLVTISLGSGRDADVIFLFTSDICGESARQPRHAKAYGDLAALRARAQAERIEALAAFRAEVLGGHYPADEHVAAIEDEELAAFVARLRRQD